MENYIVINGKKAELTEEQLEKLGIKVKKDPFERVGRGVKKRDYYFIGAGGDVVKAGDLRSLSDDSCFDAANYCTDKELMEQRALHETLNRLLWRYSMQHGGDKLDWEQHNVHKWHIVFDHDKCIFDVYSNQFLHVQWAVHFYDQETAKAAIEEIVKPFIEQHPEFKW